MYYEIEVIGVETKTKFILIPYQMIKDKKLLRSDLIIYGEILSLTKSRGYCFTTNNYFMKENKVSKSSLIRSLNRLKENGYIFLKYQCNGTNLQKRIIYLNNDAVSYLTLNSSNVDTKDGITNDIYNI